MNSAVLRLILGGVLLGGATLGMADVFSNRSAPVQFILEQLVPVGQDPSNYWRGEPVPLQITLRYPEAARAARRAHNARQAEGPVPTLRLCGPGQAWPDLVTVSLERQIFGWWKPVGGPLNWRAWVWAGAVQKGTDTASVIGSRPLWIPFSLTPSMTEQLSPGKYRVNAVLDTRKAAGDGWHGQVAATTEFTLRPLSTNPADQSRIYLGRAFFARDIQRDPAAEQQLAAKATQLDPANAVAWHALAKAARSNRDWSTVVSAGRKYLSLPSKVRPEVDEGRGMVESLVGFAERKLREKK